MKRILKKINCNQQEMRLKSFKFRWFFLFSLIKFYNHEIETIWLESDFAISQ